MQGPCARKPPHVPWPRSVRRRRRNPHPRVGRMGFGGRRIGPRNGPSYCRNRHVHVACVCVCARAMCAYSVIGGAVAGHKALPPHTTGTGEGEFRTSCAPILCTCVWLLGHPTLGAHYFLISSVCNMYVRGMPTSAHCSG